MTTQKMMDGLLDIRTASEIQDQDHVLWMAAMLFLILFKWVSMGEVPLYRP